MGVRFEKWACNRSNRVREGCCAALWAAQMAVAAPGGEPMRLLNRFEGSEVTEQ
jgi:hypothetical protein